MGSKNGTGTIAVNSAQIKNTKAELDKAFLNENANPSVWVDDSSLEIMNSTYGSFKEATENISAAIVGFNQYLDSMATAFEKKDTELAFDIQDLQIKILLVRRDMIRTLRIMIVNIVVCQVLNNNN